MTIQVRPAVLDDAAPVAEVRVSSWRVAYDGIVPGEVLDGMDPVAAAERTRVSLADPANPLRLRVAERNGVIVGFTITGPYRGGGVPENSGEVMAIYAHPDHWSTGVGRVMMDDALDDLATAGLGPVFLWVLRDNARARRFYERAGFAFDGIEQLYTAGGVPLPELRYRKDIP
ncbi:MAG TPA: GNAT family N-acetyltransferase [Mycobacteriales bacterium]|nr:GNAT family N-acetyltransferase [Mycobacteriales bacterium]